jgi:hypothetical protein
MRIEYADKQRSSRMSGILFLFLMLSIAAVLVRSLFVRWPDQVVTIVMSIIFGSSLAVVLSLAVQVLLVLRSLPHMRYELRDDALYLILGPWKNRISYNSITDVVRKDLAFSVLSSFRMPGIAVFDVIYSDEGTVRMYSTHELADVTLIKTRDGKKYGISPANPDGFMAALKQACTVGAVHEEKSSTTSNVTTVPVPIRGRLGWAAWVSLSLAMATLVISLAMFARLPATLIIHWDLLGMPNGSLPRFWGAFLIPFLTLFFAVVPLVIPDSTGTARKTWYILVVSVLGILFLCQLFLLLWNMRSGTTIGKIFVPLLIILIAGSIVAQFMYILRLQRQGKQSSSRWMTTNLASAMLTLPAKPL